LTANCATPHLVALTLAFVGLISLKQTFSKELNYLDS
jgi:hypothetical protein